LTIKLLITGLAVFVPTSNGEVTIVQLEAEDHHAFLGYPKEQWRYEGYLEFHERTEDRHFGWVKLHDLEVWLNNARSRRNSTDPELGMFQRVFVGRTVPNPENDEHLRAVDWIPQMSWIDERFSVIEETTLARDPYELIQSRATFEFTSYQACRFEGRYLEKSDVIQVREYDFQTIDGQSKRKQALAASVLFEARIPYPVATCPEIKVSIREFATGAEIATLKAQSCEPLELALLNLVKDDGGKTNDPCHDPGAHFRYYYKISDFPAAEDSLPLPQCSSTSVEVPRDRINDSCKSAFYLDELFSDPSLPEYRRNIPPGTRLATPEGYKAGPPLCSPLMMEQPE
jgi:hypothetical protein